MPLLKMQNNQNSDELDAEGIDVQRYSVRGFLGVRFDDAYGQHCSFQQSSAIEPHIWLGVDNTGPHILGPSEKYNEPVRARMHLNVEQARAIIRLLQQFVNQ